LRNQAGIVLFREAGQRNYESKVLEGGGGTPMEIFEYGKNTTIASYPNSLLLTPMHTYPKIKKK